MCSLSCPVEFRSFYPVLTFPAPINFSHDLLSPPDRIADGADRRGNPCSSFVLCQLTCCKDTGSDEQHALSTFVHSENLAYSLFIRHGDILFWKWNIGQDSQLRRRMSSTSDSQATESRRRIPMQA